MCFYTIHFCKPSFTCSRFSNGDDHRDKSLRSSPGLETIFCARPKSVHGLLNLSPVQPYAFSFSFVLTIMFVCFFLCPSQTSRDERPSSAPAPEAAGNGSQELLEETLKGPKPYPNIVLPTSGGFWIDGQDQNEYESTASSGGAGSWNNKIETDDTAKAYRRYYMGRVSIAQ